MRPSLDAFFHPRAVAVVGASHDPSKVGGSVLANLRAGGFTGRIVAVNAARASVQGLPAKRSLLEVEAPVDLAVVAVPAACVQTVLEQCVARSIPAAIVITGQPSERGRQAAADVGATGYLAKPFSAAALTDLVRQTLGRPV